MQRTKTLKSATKALLFAHEAVEIEDQPTDGLLSRDVVSRMETARAHGIAAEVLMYAATGSKIPR